MNQGDRLSITLCVSELPKGYYRSQLASLVRHPDTAHVTVVAQIGWVDDWAAYIGWPEVGYVQGHRITPEVVWYCDNRRTIEQIAAYGDKLSEEEARALFPSLAELQYRL